MKKIFRRLICAIASVTLAFSFVSLSACIQGTAGPAGPMGQDMNFYDVFNAVNLERENNGLEPLTVSEFVKEYFGYISSEAEEALTKRAVMNYSLLSSVAILSEYTVSSSSLFTPAVCDVYAGSGVIVDIDREAGDAYIVTNAHVVYESDSLEKYCDSVYVYLYGADEPYVDYNIYSNGVVNYNGIPSSEVEVIGVSLSYDLAVLKVTDSDVIKNSRAVAASFAKEEEFYAGESVYAVGNPEGAGITVTEGLISRDSEYISVEIDEIRDFRVMRTDAAVNGGNSGGGLFNMDGEIVGIINSKSEDAEIDNIAFALPSSYARRIVQSMIDNYESSGSGARYVKSAQLGINLTASNSYAYYDGELGVTRIYEMVAVASIEFGSPAVRVLRAGDIIKKFSIGSSSSVTSSCLLEQQVSDFTVTPSSGSVDGGQCSFDVTRVYMISDAMFSARKGDVVELVIERDGNEMYAYIVIDGQNYKTFN